MKRTAAIIILTLAVLTWSAPSPASATAPAVVVPTAIQGPPIWQSDWSPLACTYICAQVRVGCVIVGYLDVLCTATARSVFAKPVDRIVVRAELYAAGWPPETLRISTKNCGQSRSDPTYGICTNSASAPIGHPGVYVARAIVYVEAASTSARPIATAQVYVG